MFTALEIYSGSWQVVIKPKDRQNSAFVCHSGQLQSVKVSFGLTNTSGTFQGVLHMILSRYKWRTFLVYFDDEIIYSKSGEEHIRHVEEVLTALKNDGVKLKMNKCTFFIGTVE